MLFNSYVFIFKFLPIVLLGFYLLGCIGRYEIAKVWLVLASLFFYGWWEAKYLILILLSIGFNYGIGAFFSARKIEGHDKSFINKLVLILGIVANLLLLGYFKYANFLIESINWAAGFAALSIDQIILPLAISFFTFQQVAYLVDAYRGETHEYNFIHYCLFITFFPQLIAGPIVHHKEMLPQFEKDGLFKAWASNLAIGGTIFFFGLFKKVMIADTFAIYATPIFSAAVEPASTIGFIEGWGGALSYTFQLYFDFSGYSDMAIGLGILFGIRLPLNFYSPYKAVNIIDFWRRWHMTLSRFLRDYLYIPLGGNRKGRGHRHVNLMITMVLGGLWHGAGWTFVVWGALHGVYLIINHAWHAYSYLLFPKHIHVPRLLAIHLGRSITFIAVVISWVFFRSETFAGATNIIKGMLGMSGLYGTEAGFIRSGLKIDSAGWSDPNVVFIWIMVALVIVWYAPNTQNIMCRYKAALDGYSMQQQDLNYIPKWLTWRPTIIWGFVTVFLLLVSVSYVGSPSEFLYFQF